MSKAPIPAPPADLPLPPGQFQRFLLFWHLIFLGSLALLLGLTLWHARPSLGGREAALAAMVAVQAGLYIWFFVREERWPLPGSWLALYFGTGLGLWLVERWLEPEFFWLVWTYVGQMLGILPPRTGLLAALAVATGGMLLHVGPQTLLSMPIRELLGLVVATLAWGTTWFFLHQLTRTNRERARLIAELEAAKTELEAARRRDAELAALRERERISRDLHDGLGHTLSALSIQLEAVQRLYQVDPVQASARIDAMKEQVRSSMAELRSALHGLRAPGLGERPLVDALHDLTREVAARTGLAVSCAATPGSSRLPPPVAEALWRVAQEALSNVERHSHARRVEVSLAVTDQGVELSVTDDGVGLPPDAMARPGHYGLRGIRERVEGLGGTLRLASGTAGPAPARPGTRVEARLPLIGLPSSPAPDPGHPQ